MTIAIGAVKAKTPVISWYANARDLL